MPRFLSVITISGNSQPFLPVASQSLTRTQFVGLARTERASGNYTRTAASLDVNYTGRVTRYPTQSHTAPTNVCRIYIAFSLSIECQNGVDLFRGVSVRTPARPPARTPARTHARPHARTHARTHAHVHMHVHAPAHKCAQADIHADACTCECMWATAILHSAQW